MEMIERAERLVARILCLGFHKYKLAGWFLIDGTPIYDVGIRCCRCGMPQPAENNEKRGEG